MNRRKRMLVLAASLLAFGIGFISTLRSAPAQDRSPAVLSAAAYSGR
jgi:hypothetical protein